MADKRQDYIDFDGKTVIPLLEQVSELNKILIELIKM